MLQLTKIVSKSRRGNTNSFSLQVVGLIGFKSVFYGIHVERESA
jgi:hypothetical protein